MLNYKQIVKEKKAKRIKSINNGDKTISKTNILITVRLNKKTIITIRDISKFDYWKEKYPEAVIL
jgi:hypothetical protein